MPRDISSHQHQAVTSKERMVWERGLTVKPYSRRVGCAWEKNEAPQIRHDGLARQQEHAPQGNLPGRCSEADDHLAKRKVLERVNRDTRMQRVKKTELWADTNQSGVDKKKTSEEWTQNHLTHIAFSWVVSRASTRRQRQMELVDNDGCHPRGKAGI